MLKNKIGASRFSAGFFLVVIFVAFAIKM
jgi:hypothetical protein